MIYERFSQHYQVLEETVKSFRRVVQSCSGHFQRIYKRNHHCRPKRQGILDYSFQLEHTLTLAKNKKATRVEKKHEDLEGRVCRGGIEADSLTKPQAREKDQTHQKKPPT